MIIILLSLYSGTSLGVRSPAAEEVTNPAYSAVTDDQCKKSTEEPIGCYAEVIIPTTQVKMTPNPAYAVS